ncbi:DUF551 domain-containing protein [Enterobacter roggenkampii]|nr:DUF551 domain-containing protein [Enterobacter roggenkampii]MDD9238223.1 DUF551 domain-containing protein [Enterobacter roggenkampii]MDD9240757.1 DUF551 domain-containing protein [Enterobacter roggenkampii]
MSTISKERAELKAFITGFLTDQMHDDKSSSSLTAEVFRIALASLEAEAVGEVIEQQSGMMMDGLVISEKPTYRNIKGIHKMKMMPLGTKFYTAPPAPANAEPVAWLWSHRKHPREVTLVRPEDDERAEGAHWSGWSCQALYAAPPVPVSVPDGYRLQPISEYDAMCAAMLQGAKPVTTKDDGGRYEQDDSPECGWVVTHSGKDYFYREQKDAVTHMNSAVESGLGVSLRSFIPEPVTTAYKLPANTPCKEAPEHIWLQTAGVWPENGEFSELTWCSDNQHPDDTLYVRADVVSGNSPVIPDGWVACSERMPEIGIKVLCFPVNDEPIHATYNGQVWLQDISWSTSDEPIDNVISCNVFHWMPLPAAPQQEVTQALAKGMERYGDAMRELAKKEVK